MGDAQRTKTRQFDKSFPSKVEAVLICFQFLERTYHKYFHDISGYDVSYASPNKIQIGEALVAMQERMDHKD